MVCVSFLVISLVNRFKNKAWPAEIIENVSSRKPTRIPMPMMYTMVRPAGVRSEYLPAEQVFLQA
jgi:hypothetical protein